MSTDTGAELRVKCDRELLEALDMIALSVPRCSTPDFESHPHPLGGPSSIGEKAAHLARLAHCARTVRPNLPHTGGAA